VSLGPCASDPRHALQRCGALCRKLGQPADQSPGLLRQSVPTPQFLSQIRAVGRMMNAGGNHAGGEVRALRRAGRRACCRPIPDAATQGSARANSAELR